MKDTAVSRPDASRARRRHPLPTLEFFSGERAVECFHLACQSMVRWHHETPAHLPLQPRHNTHRCDSAMCVARIESEAGGAAEKGSGVVEGEGRISRIRDAIYIPPLTFRLGAGPLLEGALLFMHHTHIGLGCWCPQADWPPPPMLTSNGGGQVQVSQHSLRSRDEIKNQDSLKHFSGAS